MRAGCDASWLPAGSNSAAATLLYLRGNDVNLGLEEDATAAWDHLVLMQGVDPSRNISLRPLSRSSAVAAELALRRVPACSIAFESTFTTMAEMGRLDYPMMPVDWLLGERFDTLSKIGRLDLPMLFVHGTADEGTCGKQ